MFLKYAGGNAIAPSGAQKKRFIGALPATTDDGLPTKAQVEELIQDGIGTDILDNTNVWSGNNSWSGTATFVNAAGATTDKVTPRSTGAGTEINAPAGVFSTASVAAASLKSGGVYGLAKEDGLTVTLPALSAANVGYKLKFHITTTCTSVGYVINVGEAGDVFVGSLWCTIANPDAANDMELNVASGTVNRLTLGATTACGIAGGWFEITAISATQWAISGVCLGSGVIANNLFTTV